MHGFQLCAVLLFDMNARPSGRLLNGHWFNWMCRISGMAGQGRAQTVHKDTGFQRIAEECLNGGKDAKHRINPIKKGFPLPETPLKLVAGVGFEPTTFRL